LSARVLHFVAVLRIQAAGGGHLRSRIAGEWSPDEDEMETSNDCNRLCNQAR
jgi:hypothetical protein